MQSDTYNVYSALNALINGREQEARNSFFAVLRTGGNIPRLMSQVGADLKVMEWRYGINVAHDIRAICGQA